jgi:hypothetical protein
MNAYKYRGIEKDFDRDLDSLSKNQIYAAPFIKLNDPFEGLYNEEITQLATSLGKQFKVDVSEFIEQLELIKEVYNTSGIYSLSATFSEELMWAHYANSHKGFCIEYDTTKLKNKYLIPKTVNEIDVDYKQSPQNITYLDIPEVNKLLKKLFATKSLKWEYEKEIRLIFDSFGDKDYHSSALTGIYFGTSISPDKKQRLIDSLADKDINFYQIYREEHSYNLKRRLVHQNKRTIHKKIDSCLYEIISTNHSPRVENFKVLYKGEKIDDEFLPYFFDAFRETHATKDCNISLFDDKSVAPLIDKTPLEGTDYIKVADHFIAMSTFDSPNMVWRYPYQDILYKEYGGNNWKKEFE